MEQREYPDAVFWLKKLLKVFKPFCKFIYRWIVCFENNNLYVSLDSKRDSYTHGELREKKKITKKTFFS